MQNQQHLESRANEYFLHVLCCPQGLCVLLCKKTLPQTCSKVGCRLSTLKPSLSMKILSIINFTSKLLSKLLSDLSIGVFDTKKFGCKLDNRQYFNKYDKIA